MAERLTALFSTPKSELFSHNCSYNELRTESSLKSVEKAQRENQNLYHNFPDKYVYFKRRPMMFEACQAISEIFIRGDYPSEKVGVGVDGDFELLEGVKDSFGEDNLEIFYEIEGFEKSDNGKFSVVMGTDFIGKVHDDEIR